MKILFVMSLMLNFAFAGDEVGNGVDEKPYHHLSAWYLGDQTVNYCVKIAHDFPITGKVVKDEIELAIKTWNEYIKKKSLSFSFEFGRLKHARDYQYGECNSSSDLTFYIGVENTKIAEQKKNFSKPFAFAVRESFDKENTTSKGYIYLSNDSYYTQVGDFWGKPHDRLHAILLHELGHVYGFAHIDGTIMSHDIKSDFQSYGYNEKTDYWRLRTIEQDIQLLSNYRLSHKFEGRINDYGDYDPGTLGKDSHDAVFKAIVGRKPVGKVKVELHLVVEKRPFKRTGKYIVTDQRGTNEYEILFADDESDYFVSRKATTQSVKATAGKYGTHSLTGKVSAGVELVRIRTANGRLRNALLGTNMEVLGGLNKKNMKLILDGQLLEMFMMGRDRL